MICKGRIVDNLALDRSLLTPELDQRLVRWHSEHACFSVFFSDISQFLFGFAQTPPLLHCLLLCVPVITAGFVLGSSVYIVQHVKQHSTQSKCIIRDRVGVEQSERASEKGGNSESRKEVKEVFVDRIAHKANSSCRSVTGMLCTQDRKQFFTR